jgi:sterol desaturase/sphingolipid hydroxylase (fatty acid hydroxylase superfamily)
VLQAHPLSQWVWLLISVQFSLEAHCGYDFPFTVDKLLPFIGLGGPEHHDLHHQWPRTNFQPFLTYADWLCGTSQSQIMGTSAGKTDKKKA